jgi:hypothetical protein
MLEVAISLSAKWSEETWHESHTIRICLVVNLAIEMLLIQLLDLQTIILILNVMLAITIFAVAGA